MIGSSSTWLALEDYFNYFLPGILWTADFLFVISLVEASFPVVVLQSLSNINQIVMAASAIVVPYLVGIILGFSGKLIHKVDKKLLGSPEFYVLDKTKKKSYGRFVIGSMLGQEFSDKLVHLLQEQFALQKSSSSIFWNAYYSLQISPYPRIQNHLRRITNLINLHEGLIPPLLVGAIISLVSACGAKLIPSIIFGTFLVLLTIGVWYRYHYFREVRAKHTFRYFYLWRSFLREEDSGRLRETEAEKI